MAVAGISIASAAAAVAQSVAATVAVNSAAAATATASVVAPSFSDCASTLLAPRLEQLQARFQAYQPPVVHSSNIRRSLDLIRNHVDSELARPDLPPEILNRVRRRFRKVGSQAAVLVGMYSAPLTQEVWEGSETAQLLWPEFKAGETRPDEWWVLLTTRSSKLKSHPGDTALPGGAIDAADGSDAEAPARAALREAAEEVNLPLAGSRVLGRLPPIISRDYSEVLTVPAVVPRPWLPHDSEYWSLGENLGQHQNEPEQGFRVVPNPAEVEHVFSAPLRLFLAEDPRLYTSFESQWLAGLYRVHNFRWVCPPTLYAHNSAWVEQQDGPRGGNPRRAQLPPAAPHEFRIWGLTAWALIQTAQVAYNRPAPFPDALILSIGDPRLQPKHEDDDPRPLMAKLWSRL